MRIADGAHDLQRLFVNDIEVPIEPLVVEVTDSERAALACTIGGHATADDSEEGRLFASLYERGLVKDVAMGPGWTAWKLSGDGLKLAGEG